MSSGEWQKMSKKEEKKWINLSEGERCLCFVKMTAEKEKFTNSTSRQAARLQSHRKHAPSKSRRCGFHFFLRLCSCAIAFVQTDQRHKKQRHHRVVMPLFFLAEKERFELSRRGNRPTPLAGAPLRPLEYFSVTLTQAAVCSDLRHRLLYTIFILLSTLFLSFFNLFLLPSFFALQPLDMCAIIIYNLLNAVPQICGCSLCCFCFDDLYGTFPSRFGCQCSLGWILPCCILHGIHFLLHSSQRAYPRGYCSTKISFKLFNIKEIIP